MRVVNIHERVLDTSVARTGELLDRLASDGDVLWPNDRWPAMRFDRPLGVGAVGGHGPIGYTVEAYVPGQSIQFRFTKPVAFIGTHRFELEPVGANQSRLRHVIEMQVRGRPWLGWALVIRPLHDDLMEDALDRAERFLGRELLPRKWSAWVRLIRWMGGRLATRHKPA